MKEVSSLVGRQGLLVKNLIVKGIVVLGVLSDSLLNQGPLKERLSVDIVLVNVGPNEAVSRGLVSL